MRTAGAYHDQIGETTRALLDVGGVIYQETAYGGAVMHWQALAGDEEYFASDSGRERFAAIVESIAAQQDDTAKPVAVSKRLEGDHKEDFIVINYVPGKTLSQRLLQQKLREKFPDLPSEQLAQAFVVDVPRIVELAKAVAENEDEFMAALHAGVAYQLATAATLTDGTLRNFIVTDEV